ncbi:hypothetical protein ACVW17_003291 [Bradyrhizobium sp. USDA 4473]
MRSGLPKMSPSTRCCTLEKSALARLSSFVISIPFWVLCTPNWVLGRMMSKLQRISPRSMLPGQTRHSLPRVAIEAAELVAAQRRRRRGAPFAVAKPTSATRLRHQTEAGANRPGRTRRCGPEEELHSLGYRRRCDVIEAHRCARETICTDSRGAAAVFDQVSRFLFSICEALQTLRARGVRLVSVSFLQDLPASIQLPFHEGEVSSTFRAIDARCAVSEFGSSLASSRILQAASSDRVHTASVNLLSPKYSKQVRNVKVRPIAALFGRPASFSHFRKQSHHSRLLRSRRLLPSKIKSAAMPATSHRTCSSCFSNQSRIACKGVVGRLTTDVSVEPAR